MLTARGICNLFVLAAARQRWCGIVRPERMPGEIVVLPYTSPTRTFHAFDCNEVHETMKMRNQDILTKGRWTSPYPYSSGSVPLRT